MGLFSRNNSASSSGQRTSARSSVSSEAQATELRGRARRRLIGALALVLAAVIVVPMLFDDDIPPEQVDTPVVVPSIIPPSPETNIAVAPAAPSAQVDVDDASSINDLSDSATPARIDGDSVPLSSEAAAIAPTPPQAEPVPVAKPKAQEPEKPRQPAKAPVERTDDGSVAMALLEGRTPPPKAAPKPATQGSFILQIAAYTTDKDAQSRRDRLVSSGVTNAYVESAAAAGKPTYRLRVGPFPSREAAQAAQARLRALGYDNGFISSK